MRAPEAAALVRLAVFVAAAPHLAAQLPATRPPAALASSPELEERLERIRSKHGVPALGGAVADSGGVLAAAAAGFRRMGAPDRVTVHDRWHLGSCTKSMTATLLARLADRGRLSFETTIGEALADDVDVAEGWKPVTIERLLAHRGGVPADLSADGLWGRLCEQRGSPTDQRRDLAAGVLARPPGPEPGTYLYSNGGFAIAGYVAERRTGRAWEDIMRDELFVPLGMKDSGFGPPGSSDALDQPRGHAAGDSRPVEPGPGADNPPAIGPAGRVHATLGDWARYAVEHLRGARGTSSYLKPGTFARIQARPATGDYAFGWQHGERAWANGRVLTHGGSNTMWFCAIWLAPGRDLAFLAVCNAGGKGAAAAVDAAVGALIAFANERPAPVKR
jgi:CubicO group peptidase (beta-lactamase class C family)